MPSKSARSCNLARQVHTTKDAKQLNSIFRAMPRVRVSADKLLGSLSDLYSLRRIESPSSPRTLSEAAPQSLWVSLATSPFRGPCLIAVNPFTESWTDPQGIVELLIMYGSSRGELANVGICSWEFGGGDNFR